MRNKSLLLVGRAYSRSTRIPQADATWTTLATLNDNSALLSCENLVIWDNHDGVPNLQSATIYDTRTNPDHWRATMDKFGPVFANQYCYMLADVCDECSPFGHVTLFGMGGYDEEHIHQFPYIAFFLGYLRALGVSYTINQPSVLLRPQRYQMENLAETEEA